MKNYNDNDIDRLLAEADDLLASIQLYETPEEELARKQKEEEKRLEELRRQEEIQKQEEERRREEERQQEEYRKQEIQQQEVQQEEIPQQKETREPEEVQQQEEKQQAEKQQTEKHRQGNVLRQKEHRQLPVVGLIFLVLSIVFMEAVTHLSLYRNWDMTAIYPILFAVGLGSVVAIVTSFFGKRVNTVLAALTLFVYGCYCDVQILYHAAYENYMRLANVRDGIWLLLNDRTTVLNAAEHILPWLVLMFLPLILWAVLGRKVIQFEKGTWLNRIILLFAGLIAVILGVLLLDIPGYELGSPYVCFYHFDSLGNLEATGKQLGMFMMKILELLELLR